MTAKQSSEERPRRPVPSDLRAGLSHLGLAAVTGAAIVLTMAIQARRRVDAARAHLEHVRAQAALVADAVATAGEIEARIAAVEDDVHRAEQVTWPVDVGTVLTRVIEALPESVSLEAIRVGVESAPAGPHARPAGLAVQLSGVSSTPAALAGIPGSLEAAGLPRLTRLQVGPTEFDLAFVVAFPADPAPAGSTVEASP